VTAYIGVGSNVGERLDNCKTSFGMFTGDVRVTRVSSFYITSPVGYLEQDDFVNCVIEVQTSLPPLELYGEMVRVERELKKNKPFKDGPRTIDLDLLLFGELVCSDDVLTVPHPRMHLRSFVLEPLAEIAPSLIHPVLQQTVETLKNSLQEKDYVRRIDDTGTIEEKVCR